MGGQTGGSGRHDPDVARLFTLATGGDGELHREPLGQTLALVALDLGVVHEEVLAAVAGQEPVATRIR